MVSKDILLPFCEFFSILKLICSSFLFFAIFLFYWFILVQICFSSSFVYLSQFFTFCLTQDIYKTYTLNVNFKFITSMAYKNYIFTLPTHFVLLYSEFSSFHTQQQLIIFYLNFYIRVKSNLCTMLHCINLYLSTYLHLPMRFMHTSVCFCQFFKYIVPVSLVLQIYC